MVWLDEHREWSVCLSIVEWSVWLTEHSGMVCLSVCLSIMELSVWLSIVEWSVCLTEHCGLAG